MAVYPSNTLQTVQTYQRSSLGYLYTLNCFISTMNTEFKDFNKYQANLGSSVTFDTPPQSSVAAGLVASWQGVEQLTQTLTCDQAANASFTVTAQQRIFNLDKGEDEYITKFGKSFLQGMSIYIETNVAKNCDGTVPVMAVDANGNSYPTGAYHTQSGAYRFYGDGVTPIDSYQQLATAQMYFDNYGTVGTKKCYLPDTIIPAIVGTGLNQFAPRRNDDTAMSWEIGDFGSPLVSYYKSNLLPLHVSGNTGVNGDTLVVVSTNDASGVAVTQITVSGATDVSDPAAVLIGDLLYFVDGVSGKPDMRYLTYNNGGGTSVSANPVQLRSTAVAASDGSGNVTITFLPALNWAGGAKKNLNNAIVAGMHIKNTPSHRRGQIIDSNAGYLAMPQLPDQPPYDTANEYDPNTGVSLRLSYGSLFGKNQTGMIYDATWGSIFVPPYCMGILTPLSQG